MKARHRLSVAAMAAAFFLFWAPGQAIAADLHVPSEYGTIQTAIWAASDGDTVLVEAGTYMEQLEFTSANITVESTAGPLETIIDADRQGAVVMFDYENTSTLRGFTLRNGLSNGSSPIRGGGVIILWANPVIEDCIITDNEGEQGGGVTTVGGGTLRRCKLIRNVASQQGAGAFIVPMGNSLKLISTLVADNRYVGSAPEAGAGIDGMVEMANCSVLNNVGGLGVFNAGGSTIKNTILYGNDMGQIDDSSLSVVFSNVQGGFDGEGNMDADPLFEPESDSYHLAADSPCIDAGTPVEGVESDIDGEARPFGQGFDMGSDEYTPSIVTAADEDPVADAGGPYEGKVGAAVVLDASASYDPDGDILLYAWDWDGDGEFDESGESATVEHVWKKPFSGPVTLMVEDDGGNTAQCTVQVEVIPAGGKRRVYAKLGDGRHRWRSDIDIFQFKGTKGEKVKISLKKDRARKGRGQKAILVLQDRIRRVWFYRVDYGNLPGKIRVTLPETGKYRISVVECPKWRRWGWGKGYAGGYRLTLKSSQEAWQTLRPTWWAEGAVVK